MSNYVTISVDNAYGQKGAYVARIVGTDPKFGFRREFLAGLSPTIFESGIYEDCDVERKGRKNVGYWFVFRHPTKPDELRKTRADKSDVGALVGTGRTVDDVRFWFVPSEADPNKGRWEFDLNQQAAPSDRDALMAERERLLARVAEIDAALAL